MNPDLDRLHPYPFERLARLLDDRGAKAPLLRQRSASVDSVGAAPSRRDDAGENSDLPLISLAIGEPRHAPPRFILDALTDSLEGLGSYPVALGLPELREAIAGWLARRFGLAPGDIDPERHILPVNGTREGLFAFAQAVVDRSAGKPLVMLPNPFYQIYEGAALLAGAEPYYLNCTVDNGYQPDLDAVPDAAWARCQLVYVCSPGNPTGAVLDAGFYERLIELADRHDFIIASDECYSEIYEVSRRKGAAPTREGAAPTRDDVGAAPSRRDDNAPPGLLGICNALGRDDFRRCVVFHSLSKRSNVPGLRSGFVAGDADVMQRFRLYRTYHGCAVPLPTQRASIPAWEDEAHVAGNRALYQRKFDDAMRILDGALEVTRPPAAFYLWARVPGGDDEAFVRELYAQQHLTVLPGSYLSRPTETGDPGTGYIRISLVPSVDACAEAMARIRALIQT